MTMQCAYRNAGIITLLAAITVGIIIAGGCGSTQLVNLWKDPSYKSAPMHKILVVAMRKDQLRRRMWEDAIVAALSERQAGTQAIASYQLFPINAPDTSALQENSKEQGFDGVLVLARVEHDILTSNVPGYITTEPVTEYTPRWNIYVTYYEAVYHPGYTDTSTVVSVRADLLLARENGRLVWSATSESVDPSSAAQFRSAVADNVADQLKKVKLVP